MSRENDPIVQSLVVDDDRTQRAKYGLWVVASLFLPGSTNQARLFAVFPKQDTTRHTLAHVPHHFFYISRVHLSAIGRPATSWVL